MDDERLTVAQLACVLQVPAAQILTWRNHDQGPQPVNDDAIPRFTRDSVEAWLAARFEVVCDDADDPAEVHESTEVGQRVLAVVSRVRSRRRRRP